jgi:integrase
VATYRKRGQTWRAEIFLKGVRDSATRDTKAEAVAWAAAREAEILAGARGLIIPKSVRHAITRYSEEVSPTHRGHRWEVVRLKKIEREIDFADRLMSEVSKADISAWKLTLLETLKTSSARREYGVLRQVFSHARDEWGYLKVSPFDTVDPPAAGRPRKRRATDKEIDAIISALGYERGTKPTTAQHYIALAMLLAVETAMRQGEILSLDEGSWLKEKRIIHLDRTKNGDERDIPLSTRAIAVLELAPTFPVAAGTFDVLFRRARTKAGLLDLHFHDLRREATSRLAKKLDPMTLAKMTGHRQLNVLISTYYAPDMSQFADALG